MSEFESTLLVVVLPVAIVILYWQVITLTRRVKQLEDSSPNNDAR